MRESEWGIGSDGPAVPKDTVRDVCIEIKKMASIQRLSNYFITEADLEVVARACWEQAAHDFLITLGVPVATLRPATLPPIVVAPANLWAYIRRALGFQTYRQIEIRVEEFLTFPDKIHMIHEAWRKEARHVYQVYRHDTGVHFEDD